MNARLVTELFKGLRHLLMPGACLACHAPLDPDRNEFCCPCGGLFVDESGETCPRCSSTVGPFTDLTDGCSHCRGESFAFARAFRLGAYEGRLRDLVLRMKQPGSEALTEAVGATWARQGEARACSLGIEVVVPVPLHWWRRWQRGFNQSEVLAREWATRLKVPCRPRWLRRVRDTAKQATLSPTARRENVRGAFRARGSTELSGKRVLLIDDVLTTGSTAHEAARALKDAGAADVVVGILAHGR